ncbi:hypothetical protein GEV33_009185 [Tenebrio molitor]|uniref:Uncharacterized protein n=1 Tax=Tenebrio molitor TaxID=7067 RepID=A0A8J6LHH9_TENMO|nr:hypothetical protein GEV33_009185 [Tenebrio molitor]
METEHSAPSTANVAIAVRTVMSPGKSELKEGPPSPSFAASPLRRPYPRKVLGVLPPLDPS